MELFRVRVYVRTVVWFVVQTSRLHGRADETSAPQTKQPCARMGFVAEVVRLQLRNPSVRTMIQLFSSVMSHHRYPELLANFAKYLSIAVRSRWACGVRGVAIDPAPQLEKHGSRMLVSRYGFSKGDKAKILEHIVQFVEGWVAVFPKPVATARTSPAPSYSNRVSSRCRTSPCRWLGRFR